MTYELTITRDTAVNSHSLSSYRRLNIVETDAAVTDTLDQCGPSYNDKIHLRGVYRTMRDALVAAMDYVGAPCKLVETTYWSGDAALSLLPPDAKPTHRAGAEIRVLASRGRSGVFVANA